MIKNKSFLNNIMIPAFILVICVILVVVTIKYELSDNIIKGISKYAWYINIKNSLLNKLSKERHILKSFEGDINSGRDVIYVLGGTIESIEHKIEKISFIKSNGLDCKVLFLSEPGFAGYSRYYDRVITNDEWIMKHLENYNLNTKDVEFIKIDPGFFGTLTEARIISKIAFERGYKRLILVTSPYHTKRTLLSFEHYNDNNVLDIYIYKDNYKVNFSRLIIEYLKLNIYSLMFSI